MIGTSGADRTSNGGGARDFPAGALSRSGKDPPCHMWGVGRAAGGGSSRHRPDLLRGDVQHPPARLSGLSTQK